MTDFTVTDMKKYKREQKKIAMLTAYDYPMGRACAQAGVDVILVGDSLGNVVLGYDDTTKVTMEDMLHHCSAVRRGAKQTFVIGDMPFMSYGVDIAESVWNAGRFIREGGSNAVKLEGGSAMHDTIKAITTVGIPVVGHIGYTPQSVNTFGSQLVRGRTYDTAKKLIEDALSVEEAGACCLVLELVPSQLAEYITKKLTIPTVGIGSGNACDGQVLVINDMFGLYSGSSLRHNKVYKDIGKLITAGICEYVDEVRTGSFPTEKNSFRTEDVVIERLELEYDKDNN